MKATTRVVLALAWAIVPAACSSGGIPGDATSGDGEETDGPEDADAAPEVDADTGCPCTPGLHNERIFVLSDDAEVWTFDPEALAFEFVTGPVCGGTMRPYSMAVDETGKGWIQLVESRRIVTLDLGDPGACDDAGIAPTPGSVLFGMGFTDERSRGMCPRLYLLSYSGSGPFREGPGIGSLGVVDPGTMSIEMVGAIDYDGGELAGTQDGRLFAFAGLEPAKLVEVDKTDASVIETIPLEGMEKTSASAFAFHGGDIYFFTEAPPSGCIPCLLATCPGEYAACVADPACEDHLVCAMYAGEVSDECGGLMSGALQSCMFVDCLDECDVATVDRVSRVTRMDYDGSDGAGRALTVVVEEGPIRVVGAGTSPCVPLI
jgi:hypothetical protein